MVLAGWVQTPASRPHAGDKQGAAAGAAHVASREAALPAPSPCVSGRLHCMASRSSTSSSPSGRRITSSPPKMNSLLPTRQPCNQGQSRDSQGNAAGQKPCILESLLQNRSPPGRACSRAPLPSVLACGAWQCEGIARPRTEWPPRGLGRSSPSSAVHSRVLQVPALASSSRTGISGSDSLACCGPWQRRAHRPAVTMSNCCPQSLLGHAGLWEGDRHCPHAIPCQAQLAILQGRRSQNPLAALSTSARHPAVNPTPPHLHVASHQHHVPLPGHRHVARDRWQAWRRRRHGGALGGAGCRQRRAGGGLGGAAVHKGLPREVLQVQGPGVAQVAPACVCVGGCRQGGAMRVQHDAGVGDL